MTATCKKCGHTVILRATSITVSLVKCCLCPPSVEAEVEKGKIAQAQERNQRDKVRDGINQLKEANAAISLDEWISKLRDKYQNLRDDVVFELVRRHILDQFDIDRDISKGSSDTPK
jgi:hypothetical protein